MSRFLPSLPARLVFLGIVLVGALLANEVRGQVDTQRAQKLEQRSGEASLALASGLSETRSALRLLASVPVETPGSPQLFEQASASLLTGATRLVAVGRRRGAVSVVDAAVGEELVRGDVLTGPRLELVDRAAAADDVVASILHEADGVRLGAAFASADGRHVVLRESLIDPATAVESVRNQPFSDIDIALYAAPTPDPRELVLRSAAAPPLLGETFERPLEFGGDDWLLVTASRGALLTSFSRNAVWATLIATVVLATLLAALVEMLVRRRGYALALVESRTAELERALVDQRRLEAAANDANRSKSEFLSRMSHELRTPLNAVLGFAQLLELEELEPTQLDSLHQISKGGRHLLDLINEVLDLTRIETGTITLSSEPVHVGDVLVEALDLLQAMARVANVHLVNDAPTCDVHVFADRQRLKQILLNLLSNAIKYNRIGGIVSTRCSVVGDRLRLEVLDTGPGIAADDVARLFQPFERLGAERTDVQGTGIGLALSRRLATAMGGILDVESSVGRGSVFWLELPVVEGPVERYERLDMHRSGRAPDGDAPGRSILYIEDNVANVRLVERVLEMRPQVELLSAMQGRLGLDLARQHQPFAILLDLHLPDCEGEDVLRQLRDDPATAAIPVVILSADATPGRVQRIVAAGARAYLTKPLDVRQLLETVDDLLADAVV